jgi:type I restriction enzyme S subunit
MKEQWQTKKLGDVCTLIKRGISPSYQEEGGIRVLNQKCIRDHAISYEPSRRHNLNAKSVPAERYIQVGDVLVNSTGTGTLGRVAQVRKQPQEATTVDSHVTIVRPAPGVFFRDFFGYMLLIIEDALKDSGEGCGGQTELARSALAEQFLVSYPVSLSEQQRIVTLLDEAFASLATAKANAEQNLQNARALFQSHLQELFEAGRQNWETCAKPLADLCELIVDCEHKTAPTQAHGIPSIRTPNIGKGRLMLDNVNRVSEGTYLEWTRRAQPREGDLILAREAPAGNVAVIPTNTRVCLGQRTVLIRPQASAVNSYFLVFLLLEPVTQARLLAHSRGATVQHINMKDIRSLTIESLPSVSEQSAISASLWALEEESQYLTSLYERKLAALKELQKSLLHQAFAGEL